MKHDGRRLSATAAALALMGLMTPPRAFASGEKLVLNSLTLFAVVMTSLPLIAAAAGAIGTLFGRPGGLKFLFGFPLSVGVTIFALLFFEDEKTGFVTAAVLGVLVIGAHVVRFGFYLLNRATGGRNKETLKKWWRYF